MHLLQRYFVDDQNDVVKIQGDDYHHITRVMRMTIGDHILCCNSKGQTAEVEITNITDTSVIAHVVKWVEKSNELPISITIASGLPKGDKLELIIQKGTEMGASSFVPFNAARSIVKWDAKKGGKKLERWSKIAKEAAEQSHRSKIPTILSPLSFKELINHCGSYKYKVIAYEEDAKQGEASKLVEVFSQLKQGENIVILFGPEGGFTDNEIKTLKENGFISCGLGPRILRTETAPLYVLAAASFYFELMR